MKLNSIANNVTGQTKTGQSSVESSLHGLATIIALMVALFCSGQIWSAVFPLMHDYLASSYGSEEIATLGAGAFSLLSIATVFFISRIVFVIGLMVLAQNVLFRFAF